MLFFRLAAVRELIYGIAQRVVHQLPHPSGDVRPVVDFIRCRLGVPRDVTATVDQEELEACA